MSILLDPDKTFCWLSPTSFIGDLYFLPFRTATNTLLLRVGFLNFFMIHGCKIRLIVASDNKSVEAQKMILITHIELTQNQSKKLVYHGTMTFSIMMLTIPIRKCDTQRNNTQHNSTQHNGTQHNDTVHYDAHHTDKKMRYSEYWHSAYWKLSIMTLSTIALRTVTLRIITIWIMTLRILKLSIMTLSTIALSIMTLRIITLSTITLSIITGLVFVGKARNLPKWSPFQVLFSRVGSWPCPQTLDFAGKAFQGQTF